MGRHAQRSRHLVANDNSRSGLNVRVSLRPLDDRAMGTAAEVFLQLLHGNLPAANDNCGGQND
jgi:hypothetical protein